MAQHHEDNSATNIAVSVAGALFFPIAGIIQQGTSAAISSTAAGLSASVASTAISFAGSHVVKAMYRDEQLREADAYELQIMDKAGWMPAEVAGALDVAALRITEGEGWLAELRTSKARVDQIVMGPVWPLPPDIASVAGEPAPPSIPTRSEWLHAVARIGEPFRPEADNLIVGLFRRRGCRRRWQPSGDCRWRDRPALRFRRVPHPDHPAGYQPGQRRLRAGPRAPLDGLGNLYLLGTFNDAVFKFSRDGRYITRLGSAGDQPVQFSAPSSIAVDNQGRIYVGDIHGIQIFDSDGRYLDHFEVEGFPFGMAFDDQNRLFVVTNAPKVIRLELKID